MDCEFGETGHLRDRVGDYFRARLAHYAHLDSSPKDFKRLLSSLLQLLYLVNIGLIKMFDSASGPVHIFTQSHAFTPHLSSPLSWQMRSPLSPRNSNNCAHSFSDSMTSFGQSLSSCPQSQPKESSFSKRTIKPNPLLQRRGDDGRETRRNLFLKKVRESSEDKKWAMRGGEDEMMRTIWIAEQRRLAEKRTKEAMAVPTEREEEETELQDAHSGARSLGTRW